MAHYEQKGNLNIWWFPRDFSQSRFGEYHQSGSNSCTLISLLLANKVAKEHHGFLRNPKELPRSAFGIFSMAINEGNAAYSRAFGTTRMTVAKSQRHNLSIPDAMQMLRVQASHGFHLKEWFFTHLHAEHANDHYVRNVASQLSQIFSVSVELFRQPSIKDPSRFLFSALISDSRTIIFIFEFATNMVSLFDSHQHGRRAGALIAQCYISHIYELLYWYVQMQYSVYSSYPSLYEISFLTVNMTGLPTPRRFSEVTETVGPRSRKSH